MCLFTWTSNFFLVVEEHSTHFGIYLHFCTTVLHVKCINNTHLIFLIEKKKQSLKSQKSHHSVHIHICNTNTHWAAASSLAIPARRSFAPCLCVHSRGVARTSGELRDTFSPWLTLRTEPRPDGLFLFGVFCVRQRTDSWGVNYQARGCWGAAVQWSAVSLFMKVTNSSSTSWGCSAFSFWLPIFLVLLLKVVIWFFFFNFLH